MKTDRNVGDEGTQNLAERLIDRVSGAAEQVGEAGHAIAEGVQDRVEQLTSRWHREEPTLIGQPIPIDVRPVRPKQRASTWLAWRDNRWVPVHRVKDLG